MTFFERSLCYPEKKEGAALKIVIYLDVLLLTNFMLAAMLLLAAGLLSDQRCSGARVIFGGVLAAASSLVLLAPTLPWPLALLYQAGSGTLVVLAAYGWPGLRAFGGLLLRFWLLNLLLAGAALLPGVENNNGSLYFPLSPGLLLGCAGGMYLILQGMLHVLGRGTGDACFPAELLLSGAVLPVRAFHDTGFSVREPLSGREVVLVRFQSVENALPTTLCTYLKEVFAGREAVPPPELGVRFVPCDTVAGHCLLPAVPAQALRCSIRQGRKQVRTDLYAAFCDAPAPPSGWTLLLGSGTARAFSLCHREDGVGEE